MSELKNGVMVWVSDVSDCDAEKNKSLRRFIGLSGDGRFVCEILNHDVPAAWNFAVKVPEKKLMPWDINTVPIPPFCIRSKANKNKHGVVTGINTTHVIINNDNISYRDLLDYGDLVLSRDDIQPCGVEIKED